MPAEFWVPLVCALVVFAALWPVSIRLGDVSIVDFVWAPGFLLQIGAALIVAVQVGGRAALIFCLIAAWSVRLGWTLIGRRLREGHEDPRYAEIRRSWGTGFWWKSVFIVFLLQAIVQWTIASGAIAGAIAANQAPGWLAWAGAGIALAGLGIEALADWQLDRFKRRNGPGKLLTEGLRAHVRHPNYSGEIAFWLGIAVIGIDGGVWLAALSPAVIAVLLVFISGAPFLNERLSTTRTRYADYRRRTPAFIPLPRSGRLPRQASAPPGE